MVNSRNKGASGEREFAGLIHDQLGIRLVRNLEQTRNGGHDLIIHPDDQSMAADRLNRFAIEVKRYAQTTPALIASWWKQAREQAETIQKTPALAYRANRCHWVVLMLSMANKIAPHSANNFDPFQVKKSGIVFLFKSITFSSEHKDFRMMNQPVNNRHSDVFIHKELTPCGKVFVGGQNN